MMHERSDVGLVSLTRLFTVEFVLLRKVSVCVSMRETADSPLLSRSMFGGWMRWSVFKSFCGLRVIGTMVCVKIF